jgi:ERCC4-related helicase
MGSIGQGQNEVKINPGAGVYVTTGDYVKLPYFTGIGQKFQKIIFLKLSKAARELLFMLIEVRDIDTNKAKYVTREPSAKSRASRAYKELNRHSIAVRVKKQTYLLNPTAIIPRKNYFDKIKKEWLKHA